MTIASAPAHLTGRVETRLRIDARTRDRMFELLSAHFSGVQRGTFERDLHDKSHVILLEDESGDVRGFSTLAIYQSLAAHGARTVVYSGDTIVEQAWWGSPALPLTWLRAVRAIAPADGADLYWLLLTSGYRTYRFLPVFFRSFWPRYDGDCATDRRLLDALADERFGERYDRRTGIVRLEHPQVLHPELLDVPDGRKHDPHVSFFVERNPGYVRGDELACLTRIHDDNLTAAGRRIARSLQAATVSGNLA